MILRTLNYGNYGLFLIMGRYTAGFIIISSTVLNPEDSALTAKPSVDFVSVTLGTYGDLCVGIPFQ